MKIILTGATGFVGEGILLECLKDERVEKVLSIFAMPFKHTYALRPTIMKPSKGQIHVKKLDRIYLFFYPLMRLMKQANPLSVIGRAVINVLESGCEKQILESKDFKILGK